MILRAQKSCDEKITWYRTPKRKQKGISETNKKQLTQSQVPTARLQQKINLQLCIGQEKHLFRLSSLSQTFTSYVTIILKVGSISHKVNDGDADCRRQPYRWWRYLAFSVNCPVQYKEVGRWLDSEWSQSLIRFWFSSRRNLHLRWLSGSCTLQYSVSQYVMLSNYLASVSNCFRLSQTSSDHFHIKLRTKVRGFVEYNTLGRSI